MSSTPTSFREVIGLWPTRPALVRDLEQLAPDLEGHPSVDAWFARNSIPERWFDPMIAAATHRQFHEVTYRLLADFARARRDAGPR